MPSSAPSSSSSKQPSRTTRKVSSSSRASITSGPKTEILINIYDLLPPGRLSSLLWTIGGSLLHSGVVIKGREYAYGGHNKRGVTGVYWTKPRFEPPGGTWRCEVLHGFSYRSEQEIEAVIQEVSEEFLGPTYNLLTHNCNHFTSTLCERLTAKPAPTWLNRAASIGLALPCVVPREWVTPPDHDTAEGELLANADDEEDADGEGSNDDDDDDDETTNEQSGMLDGERRRRRKEAQRQRQQQEQKRQRQQRGTGSGASSSSTSLAGGKRLKSRDETPPPRLVSLRDTSGRVLPVTERAPVPSNTRRASSMSMSAGKD